MKRLFIIAILFLSCVITNAQEVKTMPRDVDVSLCSGYIRHSYPVVGLVNLAAEWKKVVKEEAAPALRRVKLFPLLHAGRVHRHPLLCHTSCSVGPISAKAGSTA